MEAHETRVALVTGGNRGIGLEICRQLSSLGHRVVVTARDARRADEAARGLAGWASGDTAGVKMDVTDDESVRGAFEQAVELYGAVDVLVNNAGIALDGPQHRASAPEFVRVRETLETNLFGAWRCAAEAVPLMQARGYGRIVNLSSTMASLELTESPSSPAYRASKAGLNMLTRVLAAELHADGILVNAASPGYTRTDMSPDADRPVEQGRTRRSGWPRSPTTDRPVASSTSGKRSCGRSQSTVDNLQSAILVSHSRSPRERPPP